MATSWLRRDWESQMEQTLIVGIPGAYVIGLFANMHAPRLAHFLESRKLLKRTKTRKQALIGFNRIKAFRENRRDRYPYYMLLASSATMCAIFAAVLFLMIYIHAYELPISIEYLIVAFLAIIAVLFAFVFLIAIYETARQIERFDDYKAEFEKRWGPIDDEDL
jgi:hypothetical protein